MSVWIAISHNYLTVNLALYGTTEEEEQQQQQQKTAGRVLEHMVFLSVFMFIRRRNIPNVSYLSFSYYLQPFAQT